MPNWCFTKYAIKGDKKEVTYLYKKMRNLQNRKESLLPNGFGNTWLGNLMKALGAEPVADNCRGDWDAPSLKLKEDGTLLTFTTESAWRRCFDVETFIRLKFGEHISVFFLEEESGMGVWLTNDKEGKYFPERVIIYDQQLDETKYFSFEDALYWLNDRLEVNSDNPTWEEIEKALDKRNKLAVDSENNTFISVRRVEITEE